MGLFSYLYNVVTGQYAHWNDTNNQIVSSLWERVESLDPPQETIYRHFVIGAALCVDYLLNPDKGEDRVLNVNPREVDFDQFRELYTLLLSSMARTYEALNPSLSSIIRDGYKQVTGTQLEGGPMPLSRDEDGDPDLSHVATEIWGSVVEVSGSDQGDTMLEAYPFITLYLTVLSDAFEDINNEIDVGAP